MESIKEYDIIQPLLVRKEENDTYEIISDHRRFLAAARLELKAVPVDVLDVKKQRQNGSLNMFSAHFIKLILQILSIAVR